MNAENAKRRLKDINKALKVFPKVVKEQERVHREKEKIIKPFMKVAKDLQRRTDKAAKVGAKKARPEFIKHYSEIQEPAGSYPGSDELMAETHDFGKSFGFNKLGIGIDVLKPGRRASWPHAHKAEEEFVYVIEGNPQVWIDGELHDLEPGDGVGFVPGTGIAHTFINNTKSDVKLFIVGEHRRPDDKWFYALHPARNQEIGDRFWQDVPKRDLGPHDGLPDKAKRGVTKAAKRKSKAGRAR
jgi:uncharacterized cupin superfamily protein